MKNQLINRLNPITVCGSAALVAVSAIALSPQIAEAVVMTQGCALQTECTLLEMIDGGSILVDNIFFGVLEADGAIGIDPSLIRVIGLDDDPLNPGLKYDLTASPVSSEIEDAEGFDFLLFFGNINQQPTIKDNSLRLYEDGFSVTGDTAAVFLGEELDGLEFPGSLIKAACAVEDPATTPIFGFCQDVIANVTTNGDPDNLITENQLFDHIEFADVNFPSISTGTANNIVSGSRANDIDTFEITMFEQRFSQVPEPLTMFGAATAAGFGAFFTRKVGKKDKK